MYYYKARMYSESLGRFMQTDPTGYADGTNWYNYVSGDPINLIDPSGLATFQLQDCNNNISGPSTSNSAGDVVLTQTTCTSYYVTFPDAGPVATQFFGGGNGGGGKAGSCHGSNGMACGYFTPRTKVDMCLDKAARETGISIVLDLAGFIPGESQAVALFQLTIAPGALINGAFHGDLFGMSAAGAAYSNTAASQAVKSGGFAATRAIPFVGLAVNGAATYHDVSAAVAAYNRCMREK